MKIFCLTLLLSLWLPSGAALAHPHPDHDDAAPAAVFPDDGRVIEATLAEMVRDYDDYAAERVDLPFDRVEGMYLNDLPAYRGRRVRVAAVVDEIETGSGGSAVAVINYADGDRRQIFHFRFAAADPESLARLWAASLDRRPVTIVGTVVAPEVMDILIEDCVVE